MRRSAAPSVTSSTAKRAKFQVPFARDAKHATSVTKKPNNQTSLLGDTGQCSDKLEHCKTTIEAHEDTGNTDATHRLITTKVPVKHKTATTVGFRSLTTSGFKPPTLVSNTPIKNASTGDSSALSTVRTGDLVKSNEAKSNEETRNPCYYNVMWCKLSNKKNKKWESDAFLITTPTTATLVNLEGKEIGKSTGYKLSELKDLLSGQTLIVGRKEVEIISSISDTDWATGKCFRTATNTTNVIPQIARQKFTNKFSSPLKSIENMPTKDVKITHESPRHDPNAPDALVMPRPSVDHQRNFNTNKLCVVDVVVDPYISRRLRPHQRDGVIFLYECVMGMRDFSGFGAILADEMGLGKSLQCIALIWTLYKQGMYGGKAPIKRTLLVTPGSLVQNWSREFRKWLGIERFKVFPVSSDKRVEEFIKYPQYPLMIISYEMFVRSCDTLKGIKFDLLICDEGHRLKNSSNKTFALISSVQTRRRVLVTGTPIQNDLQEFYAIVEFCNPGILGSEAAFRRIYEDPIAKSRLPGCNKKEKNLGESRAIELSRLTKLFCLRRTQEVIIHHLPPKVEYVIFCRTAPLQVLIYRHLLSSRLFKECISAVESNYCRHFMCINALRKVCNEPNLIYEAVKDAESHLIDDEIGKSIEEEHTLLYAGIQSLYPPNYSPDTFTTEHSGKLAVLSNLLDWIYQNSPKEKVVVVSNFTRTLDVLQKMCKSKNYRYVRLDGSTPTSKRHTIVENFNSSYSKTFVFLLSSKAGGTGLNLIGASRLVLYDIDWNPANDLQAMARIWRDGQKRDVYIYRLVTTGTIEEKIFQRQVMKHDLSGAVMDTRESGRSQFTRKDLHNLFSLREDIVCDTHKLLGCNCCLEGTFNDADESDNNTGPKNSSMNKIEMDELMKWDHIPVPLSESVKDQCLQDIDSKNITFVFQNRMSLNNDVTL